MRTCSVAPHVYMGGDGMRKIVMILAVLTLAACESEAVRAPNGGGGEGAGGWSRGRGHDRS